MPYGDGMMRPPMHYGMGMPMPYGGMPPYGYGFYDPGYYDPASIYLFYNSASRSRRLWTWRRDDDETRSKLYRTRSAPLQPALQSAFPTTTTSAVEI